MFINDQKVKKLIGIFVALLITGYSILYFTISSVKNETFLIDEPVLFQINAGDSFYHIIRRFKDLNLLHEERRLSWLAKINRQLGDIKKGTYLIEPTDDVGKILNDFIEGNEVLFQVTFVEGIRAQDAVHILSSEVYLKHDISENNKKIQTLKIPKKNPEGYFFPDTYNYHVGEKESDILARAYERMSQELEEAWKNRAPDLPYKNPYQLLIMASIIEKETSVESERTMVAAVFINRLRIGMRLQTDPTVIYGMGDRYKGNIKRKHLREKTAYNTYQINGLPPTPIALPGKASLYAAGHPADVDYLYFVAKKDGTHKFSKTLKEHEKAVDYYQRNKRGS